MAPFNIYSKSFIEIRFKTLVNVQCMIFTYFICYLCLDIKFWNYNKTKIDSHRGVKEISIMIDDKYVTPNKGILLKRAPGFDIIDFG